ncbi:MAG TPA: zf-HC2 domain-containing protein [Polyangiales bacterium]|nr:zf-HC2 domain-containing protein [Polyangiales bacterium]
MSVEHVSDELLQRHFDGELEPGDEPVVREHLDGCAECAGKLRSLEHLQGFIRMAATDAAAQADWQGMFARIEQAAQQPEVPEITPVRPTRASAKAQARWFRGASAVGLFAAAAAALLMVYREPESKQTEEEDAENTVAVLEVHSEITHVDFGGNAGTVFDIALADGSSTPVVWINDEDETDDGEDF